MRGENVPTAEPTVATTSTSKGRRKRKSVPEDDASELAVEGIVDEHASGATGDAQQSAKKKKRKKNPDGPQETGNNGADVRDSVEVGGGGGRSSASAAPVASAKKGRKKQDKGKGKEVAPPASTDIPIDPSLTGAKGDTAYLSAVISAASASAGASSGAPAQGQLPYFTPYTFTATPGHPPFNAAATAAFAQASQNQIPSFLTDGSLPIADPNFAGLQNNEDVLRALQELDVTKLADVIRSFGQQSQPQGQGPSVIPSSISNL